MRFILDLDRLAPQVISALERIFGPLNLGSPQSQAEFSSHFFSNATFVLLTLSIPWRWSWALAFWPLFMTLGQELLRDSHWKDLFDKSPEGIDGRTDLLSRGLGATVPFVTLLFEPIADLIRAAFSGGN